MPIIQLRGNVLNGGRVTGLPPFAVGRNESPDCVDIDPSDYRGARTRPGSAQYGTSFTAASGGSAGGVYHWTRNYGTAFLLAAHSGTLYDIGTSGTWASVLTGFTVNGPVQMVGLNNLLVVAAAGTAPYISSNAVSFATLSATVATAGEAGMPTESKYTAVWKSKLFLAGDSANPQQIRFSASNDPTDFTTVDNAGVITIEGGDGDVIRGLLPIQNTLVVFKRKKVYGVFGDSPFNYSIIPLAYVGLVSEFGHAAGDKVAFFASDDGIYSVAGGTIAKISNKIRQDYEDISDKSKIVLACRGDKLFVTDAGASSPYSLVLDYKRGVWSRYNGQPYKPYTVSRAMALYGVTNASTMQVYQIDTGGGGAISPYWRTPDLDFGDPAALKHLQQAYVHMKPDTATTTLTLRWYGSSGSMGSDSTLTFGTAGNYDVQRVHGQNLKGRFLQLRMTWTGDKTVYGWQEFAEIRGEPVPGRSDQ